MGLFSNKEENIRDKNHKARVSRNEDEVLESASKLDPRDKSERAEAIRETAEDIRDHRSNK